MCARHDVVLGGESPLWAVEIGTTSLGQGVHREMESEGSRGRNDVVTNRNRIQGRCYRVTQHWMEKPNNRSDVSSGRSGRTSGRNNVLPVEISTLAR